MALNPEGYDPESELTAKLKVKTDNQDWIDETLRNLKGYGYLKSWSSFAEQFVEQAFFFGEFGSRYIIEKLKKKGLTDSVISDAIHKVSADKNIDEQSILIDQVNHYYSGFYHEPWKLVATLQNVASAINKSKSRSISIRKLLELKE